jgi:hypothetical protein
MRLTDPQSYRSAGDPSGAENLWFDKPGAHLRANSLPVSRDGFSKDECGNQKMVSLAAALVASQGI